jgi:hypothetical protein
MDRSFLGPRSATPSFPPLELPDDVVLVPLPDEVVELEPPHAAITSAAATPARTAIDLTPLRELAPLHFLVMFSSIYELSV